MKKSYAVLCLAVYLILTVLPASAFENEKWRRQFFEPSRLTRTKLMLRFAIQDFSVPFPTRQAQSAPYLFLRTAGGAPKSTQPKLVYPILGAVAGGALGIIVGGAGALVAVEAIGCEEEDCELERLFWGTVAGEAVLLSLGTHLGNKRQGNFLLDLVVSSAIAFGGVALSFENNGAAIIIATPFVQIASTVAVERLFGRK